MPAASTRSIEGRPLRLRYHGAQHRRSSGAVVLTGKRRCARHHAESGRLLMESHVRFGWGGSFLPRP